MKKQFLSLLAAGLLLGGASQVKAMETTLLTAATAMVIARDRQLNKEKQQRPQTATARAEEDQESRSFDKALDTYKKIENEASEFKTKVYNRCNGIEVSATAQDLRIWKLSPDKWALKGKIKLEKEQISFGLSMGMAIITTTNKNDNCSTETTHEFSFCPTHDQEHNQEVLRGLLKHQMMTHAMTLSTSK